jgi:hypothetical protein
MGPHTDRSVCPNVRQKLFQRGLPASPVIGACQHALHAILATSEMSYHRPMKTCCLVAPAWLLLAASLPASIAMAGQHVHSQAASGAPTRIAPMKAHTGALPALPPVPFTPSRPMAIVQQVYEFAARHPEVLQHVPCYCGCEQMGHNGNHDCFVKARLANGTVTEWEPHGIGCAICLDVGRDAMSLFNAGTSVQQIRAMIEKKYASHFPSSTPTPRP